MGDAFGIGRAQVEDDMGCAFGDIRAHAVNCLGHIIIVDRPLDRALDRRGIAPNFFTIAVQDLILVTECFDAATDKVPDIGIFSHNAQGQLLPTPTNDERWVGLLDGLGFATGIFELIILAIKIGYGLRPQQFDDFAGLTQAADALAWLIEWDTVHVALKLIPACADAKVQASMRNLIDGRAYLCQHCRVAINIAGDHQSKAHALRPRCQGAQERPTLQLRAGRVRAEWYEVSKRPGML